MIRVRPAFQFFRQMAGYPTADCIDPTDEWEAPEGYTYDSTHRRFLNDETGAEWNPTLSSLSATTIEILPESGSNLLTMEAAGMIDRGDVVFDIMPADISTVTNAWGILINSDLYRVRSTERIQPGAASETWYRVIVTSK